MGRSSENFVFVEKEWEGEKEIAFRYILTRIRFISTTPQLFTWPRLKSLRPSLEHQTVIALSLGVLPGLLVPLHFFNATTAAFEEEEAPQDNKTLFYSIVSAPKLLWVAVKDLLSLLACVQSQRAGNS